MSGRADLQVPLELFDHLIDWSLDSAEGGD